MRRVAIVLSALAALALAACTPVAQTPQPSESAATAGTPSASAAESAATPADTASATPPGSVSPDCLTGSYKLARFVAVGGSTNTTFGTGEGGDVTVTFQSGSYQLVGAGNSPITVTLAGQQASLLVNGTVTGDYTLQGDTAQFTVRDATGNATLTAGALKRTLTMPEVGSVLAPSGAGTIACSATGATITLANVRLELERA